MPLIVSTWMGRTDRRQTLAMRAGDRNATSGCMRIGELRIPAVPHPECAESLAPLNREQVWSADDDVRTHRRRS